MGGNADFPRNLDAGVHQEVPQQLPGMAGDVFPVGRKGDASLKETGAFHLFQGDGRKRSFGFRTDIGATGGALEGNAVEVGAQGPVGGIIGLGGDRYAGDENRDCKVGIIQKNVPDRFSARGEMAFDFPGQLDQYFRDQKRIPIAFDDKVPLARQIDVRGEAIVRAKDVEGGQGSDEFQRGGRHQGCIGVDGNEGLPFGGEEKAGIFRRKERGRRWRGAHTDGGHHQYEEYGGKQKAPHGVPFTCFPE